MAPICKAWNERVGSGTVSGEAFSNRDGVHMRGEAWQANVCSHSRCWLAGSYEDLQGPLQSMDEDHPGSVGSIDGGVLCPSANVLHRAATRSRGCCFFRWRGSRCGGATHLFTIEQASVCCREPCAPCCWRPYHTSSVVAEHSFSDIIGIALVQACWVVSLQHRL